MAHIALTVNSALLHGPCIRCLSSPQLSEVDVIVSSISIALERPDTWLPWGCHCWDPAPDHLSQSLRAEVLNTACSWVLVAPLPLVLYYEMY